MRPRDYIHGFSNLKSDLRTKLKIQKSVGDLALWFSVKDGMLRVHDFDKHDDFFIMAVRDPRSDSWKIYVKQNSYQYQMTEAIVQSVPYEKLADEFNRKFKMYGYWRPKIR